MVATKKKAAAASPQVAKAAKPRAAGVRKSSRESKLPVMFRPGSDLPEHFSQMIHTIVVKAAKDHDFALSTTSVSAMEDALTSVLGTLLGAASDRARKNNRNEIEVCTPDSWFLDSVASSHLDVRSCFFFFSLINGNCFIKFMCVGVRVCVFVFACVYF